MRMKETKVYQYEELSDKAKEKARDWYRDGNLDYEWWDCVFEYTNIIATALGFDLETKRDNPAIYFSGFYSQGDGACFAGTYSAENVKPADFHAHVGETESNKPIRKIAEGFFTFAKEHPSFYAKLAHTGRYSHEHSVLYDCYEEVETEEGTEDKITVETEEEFTSLCRTFMCWIYRELEEAHDWLQADEQIEASIIANEYEFTEEGRRA